MQAIKAIDFYPCSGFGSQGRSAALYIEGGVLLGIGYGATDEEAVLEALEAAGVAYAFDMVGETIKNAAIYREPVEFPHGEFPL